MVFSFAACDKTKAEKNLEQALEELQNAVNSGDVDDVSSALDNNVDALDDLADEALDEEGANYLSAKEAVAILIKGDKYKATAEQFKSQGLLYTLEARENYIAYVYQYMFDIGDTSVVKSNCDAQIDALRSAANSVLKIFAGIDGIVFEYLDYNGNIIATYKFS